MSSERSLFGEFKELIGLPVRVQLQDRTSTSGVLYCVDPEADHVALLCPSGQDASYSIKILLAHHVKTLAASDDENLPTLAELQESLRVDSDANEEDSMSPHHRREQLSQFLSKSFVPFETAADGSMRLFGGAATLREPFRTVECANGQLLRRLQQLLGQFDHQLKLNAEGAGGISP
ncbi:hypothetical protein PHYBOEH_006584 [Phytophthora boehmeriae]|uniref:Gem-associated protein 6 n=1 Tax=Phytophthora boehmeriae TaxID=109152 RepID=A0A8T1X3D1_9STRA|nr:hypothetical protein PHYBOEH_006584 [Phytophthora boehmeriae]